MQETVGFFISVFLIYECLVFILGDQVEDEYGDVKDSTEIPIFDTCGTLLDEYAKASLRTLRPDERHWFYDSYVCDRLERADNLTKEKLKNEPTLDYDNINDTTERTLYKTCGTLLQYLWEDYSLRNLTSQEKTFYYDEKVIEELKQDEAKELLKKKDQEWLKKMEDRVINEEIDSIERRRTTDIVYDDWMSPVPKTTVLVISPPDNLFLSQASNVSDTDISMSTFNREVKYGDVPKWLSQRYDKIHDDLIKKKDHAALNDAWMHGMIPTTAILNEVTKKKRRLLTHPFHRLDKIKRKLERKYNITQSVKNKTRSQINNKNIIRRNGNKRKRHIDEPMGTHKTSKLMSTLFSLGNITLTNRRKKREAMSDCTERTQKKRTIEIVTNYGGERILKKYIKAIEKEEREEAREEKRAAKEAEKLREKNKKKQLREEMRRNKSMLKPPRSSKFTKRLKTEPVTEAFNSYETTRDYVRFTRFPKYLNWSYTIAPGTYNPKKEVTEPNAEQTEVNVDDIFEILHPSTVEPGYFRKYIKTTIRRLRQTTTPYVEHTFPNRHNRTVNYWKYEREYAKHSTPTPEPDSMLASLEHSEETPLEILFGDYLFNTRRSVPTLKLNISTVTISNRQFESYLARHQIFKNIYNAHMALATMRHLCIGDTRFQKGDINMGGLGADFMDHRPYSSTRRQDNEMYQDMVFFGNFTQPDFKRKTYTFADSYEHYEDIFQKHLLDPGHVTANWTTIDMYDTGIPIAPHQIYPNGSLKPVEVLIKEDYEFKKDVYGKSFEIYKEEFANESDISKESKDFYYENKRKDQFFHKNISYTIGPKHAQKSVYDVYEDSYYENEYRKFREEWKKNDKLANATLWKQPPDESYVDPQVIINEAYKYPPTTINYWKRWKPPPTGPYETAIHFKLTYHPDQLDIMP